MKQTTIRQAQTFVELIDLWAARVANVRTTKTMTSTWRLAKDVGVTSHSVRMWRSRDRIPPSRFNDVVRAASKHGNFDVTHEFLHELKRRSDETHGYKK